MVDDATVEVENITRNLNENKPLVKAILTALSRSLSLRSYPHFVSASCSFRFSSSERAFLSPARPFGYSARLASYFLSRTVVPTFIHYLLRGQPVRHDEGKGIVPKGADIFWRIHVHFNVYFEKFRSTYGKLLDKALDHKGVILSCMIAAIVIAAGTLPFLGRDFFPLVDAGQLRLHVRTPSGTRIEETEHYFTRIESVIREEIPKDELETIMDNIGLPNSGMNLAQGDSATIGASTGEILVELNQEHHHSTWVYLRHLRARLTKEFPDCSFFAQPADIVSQILNFGLPAPIDLQAAGRRPPSQLRDRPGDLQ